MLLLDEAFSGVDVAAQEGLVEVLRTLRDEGRIVMLATHDLTNLSSRFDQVLCLNRPRVRLRPSCPKCLHHRSWRICTAPTVST